MESLTLDQLRQPDERSLVFGPFVGTVPNDRAAAILEHRQRTIGGTDLVPNVPEPIRQNFDRLRLAYVYGVLCYEIFTVVEQAVFFLLEHALGERLLEHYDHTLPLVNWKTRDEKPLRVHNFPQVHEALRGKGGSHRKGEWALESPHGELQHFTGSVTNLLKWARAQGFLRGQRSRWSEGFLVDRRNHAAHPAWHEIHSPADAAEAIRDVAELVNQLWGSATPGGRLFPAPIERTPIAVGWNTGGDEWAVTLCQNLRTYGKDDWLYVLVRGVFRDDDLTSYSTDYELTTFPTEWLWGPGSHHEAIDWLDREQPQPDTVDYLDRKLLVRVVGDNVELPRRPEVAAASDDAREEGIWHLVLADFPLVAYGHVRASAAAKGECVQEGPCPACQAHTLARGELPDVLDFLEARFGKIEREPPRGVAVPGYRSPMA